MGSAIQKYLDDLLVLDFIYYSCQLRKFLRFNKAYGGSESKSVSKSVIKGDSENQDSDYFGKNMDM